MSDVNQLRAAFPRIPESRRAFAQSLVDYFVRHNRWSPRQQFFVDQMVNEANNAPDPTTPAPAAAGAVDLNPEGVATVLGWFRNVRTHNGPRARARVTFPRGSIGRGLRLSAPSNTSRYSADDTIFVHREGEYAGRITNGFWHGARAGVGMVDTLRAVLADPLGATVSAGRMTGTCCFCARELTDSRSVHVGYGPICAGHYGLPWGDAGAEVAPGIRHVGATPDAQPLRDAGYSEAEITLAAESAARLARPARGTVPVRRRPGSGIGAPAAPARPDLRSYEDGGPDDEDRQFM